MKLTYLVSSAGPGQAMQKATLPNKREIDVPVDAFIVQLVPDDAHSPDTGSLKLVFEGEDAKAAEKLFEHGRAIEVSFAKGRKS